MPIPCNPEIIPIVAEIEILSTLLSLWIFKAKEEPEGEILNLGKKKGPEGYPARSGEDLHGYNAVRLSYIGQQGVQLK